MDMRNIQAPPKLTDLNVRDDLKHLTVLQLQGEQRLKSLPYAVAVVNVNGDLNMGMIVRSAVIFGAEKLFIFGRTRYDRRSTVGAHNYIDTEFVEFVGTCDQDHHDTIRTTLSDHGYVPVFFEQNIRSGSLFSIKYIQRPCLIFGNEGYGMSNTLIGDFPVISLHQQDIMQSLNVSATAAIACHTVMNNILEVAQ